MRKFVTDNVAPWVRPVYPPAVARLIWRTIKHASGTSEAARIPSFLASCGYAKHALLAHWPEKEILLRCEQTCDAMNAAALVASACLRPSSQQSAHAHSRSIHMDMDTDTDMDMTGILLARLVAAPAGEDTLARALVVRVLDSSADAAHASRAADAIMGTLHRANCTQTASAVVTMALSAACEYSKESLKLAPREQVGGVGDFDRSVDVLYALAARLCEHVLGDVARAVMRLAGAADEQDAPQACVWDKASRQVLGFLHACSRVFSCA